MSNKEIEEILSSVLQREVPKIIQQFLTITFNDKAIDVFNESYFRFTCVSNFLKTSKGLHSELIKQGWKPPDNVNVNYPLDDSDICLACGNPVFKDADTDNDNG